METKKTDQVKQEEKKKLTPLDIRLLIINKIKRTYDTEKGKKFIAHLIMEFFPTTKIDVVIKTAQDDMKCCITGIPLISLEQHNEKHKNDTSDIKFMISEACNNHEEVGHDENMNKLIGKRIAITVSGSKKFISPLAYATLFEWLQTELQFGNKHLNFFVEKQKEKFMYNQMNDKQKASFTKKEKIFVKEKNDGNFSQSHFSNKSATYSLADNPALQKLKQQSDEPN